MKFCQLFQIRREIEQHENKNWARLTLLTEETRYQGLVKNLTLVFGVTLMLERLEQEVPPQELEGEKID